MKQYYTNLAFLFSFLLIVNMLIAQDGETKQLAGRLDSLYTELNTYGEFNGNVLIAKKGKEIYCKSFGVSDKENGIPLSPRSIFYLASVSKQFTATAVVLLANEKKLKYSDAITQYLPELGSYHGVTIENLIHHTSGLPDYVDLFKKDWDSIETITNEEVIKRLGEQRPELRFVPGEKWQYSNTGYLLLASIIERVSKQTYGAYLDEHIFGPLNMDDTKVLFVHKDKIKDPQIAKAHYDNPEDMEYVQKLDGTYGQAKIYSTVRDLLKWDRALKNNLLVSQKDKESMFTSSLLNSGEETGYGFGWYIEQEEPFKKMVNHSGYFPGYLTYLEQHIDHDMTIIILQNNENRTGKKRLPIVETRNILYHIPNKNDVRLPEATLQKYVGVYVNEKGKDIPISLKHHSLWTNNGFDLIPVSETKFKVNGFWPEVTYTFILDGKGAVEGYRMEQPEQGVDKTLERKR
ncbi:serine hydrolase domain-containing protein [Flagellimonas hadalis]|uniref:Beta-lactamase family protein n=1 Tax=Flagellimonas hadalis TaxID=2597517 RepID=A0A5N5IKB7_9FLAO|nr:serine hydrolase domain-containing protein [Allomuricauda hadalis]KAB5484483.1 beta-lactamase family protein [Allomuricauda hadalis]